MTARRELLLAGSAGATFIGAAAFAGKTSAFELTTAGPDMDRIHFLQIQEIAGLLNSRKLSSVELTEHMLRRIDRIAPRLRSYSPVTPDLALTQAREADRLRERGEIRSPLHGIPIAVKDLFQTSGVCTAAGMVIRKLREAGAVLLGKLQLTEGAFADTSRPMPPPVNPWNPDYWPGGSSSGSGFAS